MREEFEKLANAGKINRSHVEPLAVLVEAGYCQHKGWGFGRVDSVDIVFCRVVIDFPSKAGHSMDLGFAADSLKPIPKDHILARKFADISGLRQLAALNHLEVIKIVLNSHGGKATLEQIQMALVPEVIASDWKKWWEQAKKELKKDGHFSVPAKKNEPIVYQQETRTIDERLLTDFRAARGLKLKIAAATEVLRNFEDLNSKSATVTEAITGLNADIASHQRTQPSLALEGVFLREELRQQAGLAAQPGEIDDKSIWAQVTNTVEVLEGLPASKNRRALQSYKESQPDNWAQNLVDLLNRVGTKLCGDCAALLIEEGNLALLKDHLARWISQHNASSELLLWLAKERSDAFADILGPEVFRAMLTAMERDQFNNERRSSKLADYIMDDQSLLVELIGSADIEIIKDLTRALQLSPCYDDMEKRSLLARIIKTYPAVQSLISGEQTKQDNTLVVSWDSLARRKEEYTDLVQKKIPANSKEIAIARSYGDLRENHEYKAAKEMQKILMRRKGELENLLGRARGFDFSNPNTDQVSIGTTVAATDLITGGKETYSIMGAWDSEPERGIISYLSPVGHAFLNRKAGEEIDYEMEGVRKRYRIDSITAAPALVPPQPRATSTPEAEPTGTSAADQT